MNKEELFAQLRLHRRKVINLLEESARLHEASQNLSSYAERVEALGIEPTSNGLRSA